MIKYYFKPSFLFNTVLLYLELVYICCRTSEQFRMSLWGSGAGQLGDRAPRKPPRVLHQPTALNNQEAKLANNTNKVRDEGVR